MKNLKKIMLMAVVMATISLKTFAQVSVGISISAHIAPPALPVYAQPVCPGDGYLWTPGYWAYDDADGYYWVPGVWVRPPHIGLLWTPAYWGFDGGVYGFHAGYWGPHVGFYGGINYGFGYGGVGFGGGIWAGNVFRYNTAVTRVNTTIVHNTYINNTVINNVNVNNRTSFNGQGGINARPNRDEEQAMRERHEEPTQNQLSHRNAAMHDRNQFASVNKGQPSTAAMNRVNGRRFDQQGRIANGVRNGDLTAGETKNLENRESNINKEVQTDRAANGGALTPQEHQQVNRQQNRASDAIYNDKHNANNAQFGNGEVGQRRANQQQRIANGINDGQISAGEAARAENRQQHINQQIHADRQANGGRMNMGQRMQVNRMQNRASGQIHRERHP